MTVRCAVDSNEISFMLAGRNAFSEAFKNAGPKILNRFMMWKYLFRPTEWVM